MEIFLAPLHLVYIFSSLFVLKDYFHQKHKTPTNLQTDGNENTFNNNRTTALELISSKRIGRGERVN